MRTTHMLVDCTQYVCDAPSLCMLCVWLPVPLSSPTVATCVQPTHAVSAGPPIRSPNATRLRTRLTATLHSETSPSTTPRRAQVCETGNGDGDGDWHGHGHGHALLVHVCKCVCRLVFSLVSQSPTMNILVSIAFLQGSSLPIQVAQWLILCLTMSSSTDKARTRSRLGTTTSARMWFVLLRVPCCLECRE